MKGSIIIQAWTVHKYNGEYFLPYMHWVYLNEVVKYYEKVCLLSPTKISHDSLDKGFVQIDTFADVEVYELPFSKNYVGAIKFFPSYVKAYRSLKSFDSAYVRYPTPLGWLQKVFLKRKKRIVHFVGDPMDAAKTNPNFSWFKKALLLLFFLPEHLLYVWACRGARVYTNGFHLSERIKAFGIHATPMISSTLTHTDFFLDSQKTISPVRPRLIYIGYLRTAKGVETIIKAFQLLQKTYPDAKLSIVGSGEFEEELKRLTFSHNISNITFYGHVDDRKILNQLLRSHDIFCFASLSEGSPRVILEAMANGINVVSTPVGSLPHLFEDSVNIVFANFNDATDFKCKMDLLIKNNEDAFRIRSNAFKKVEHCTIHSFLHTIFSDETS